MNTNYIEDLNSCMNILSVVDDWDSFYKAIRMVKEVVEPLRPTLHDEASAPYPMEIIAPIVNRLADVQCGKHNVYSLIRAIDKAIPLMLQHDYKVLARQKFDTALQDLLFAISSNLNLSAKLDTSDVSDFTTLFASHVCTKSALRTLVTAFADLPPEEQEAVLKSTS